MRKATCCVLTGALVVTAVFVAEARIKPTSNAHKVANSFMKKRHLNQPGADADFVIKPPEGKFAATSNSKVVKFPTRGSHFSMLSTGSVKKALRKNRSESTSTNNQGPAIRGTTDTVMLRVKFRVPKGRNCLSFEFKFLSEEFPEFVDSEFNDAFIAELDKSTWDTNRDDPVVDSPRNFARDNQGNPIRVNTVGNARVKRKHARGTTYDAATRTLRAQTPVDRGKHTLFLSIFDQGDRQYDSTVFLDRMRIKDSPDCESGVIVP